MINICALKINIESSTGLVVENAYFKITDYSCSGNVINARLRAFLSKQHEMDGKCPIEGSEEIVTLLADYKEESDNTKKQIYNHVKKMSSYANAVDILE